MFDLCNFLFYSIKKKNMQNFSFVISFYRVVWDTLSLHKICIERSRVYGKYDLTLNSHCVLSSNYEPVELWLWS